MRLHPILFLAPLAAACAHSETVERDELALSDDFDAIAVDLAAGDVTIAVSDVSEVRIQRRIRYVDDRPEPVARVRDGVLELAVDCRRCSVDHRVFLPHGADLELVTGAGDVAIRGVDGTVHARTAAGDLALEDLVGEEVFASTAAGDVLATGLDASWVAASSEAGDVDVELVTAAELTELTTAAGDVDLRAPAGDYDIETWAPAGRIRIDDLDPDPSAARAIFLSSSAGDVTGRGTNPL